MLIHFAAHGGLLLPGDTPSRLSHDASPGAIHCRALAFLLHLRLTTLQARCRA